MYVCCDGMYACMYVCMYGCVSLCVYIHVYVCMNEFHNVEEPHRHLQKYGPEGSSYAVQVCLFLLVKHVSCLDD